jgi:PAS domain S-box-containing protein
LLRRAFDIGNRTGDLTCAAFSCSNLNLNLLAAGEPLFEVEREIRLGLEFARTMRFGLAVDLISIQLAGVRTLRGLTRQFGSLNDQDFDESRIEHRFSRNPNLALPESRYWIRKLQVRFLAGDYPAAIDAASRAQRLLWTQALHLEAAEYHLYAALSHAAACNGAPDDQQRRHLDALLTHHRQFETWAGNCAENFRNCAALIGAELARIETRDVDAMRLYEEAIHMAQANGFVHNEAIAYERASTFYRARGFAQFADLYLRNARHSYLRWGAVGKVQQLDQLYPHLGTQEPADRTSTIGAPVEHLDLATVIDVSQAASGEIVLEKLLDRLMRTAIEHAGAERGLLILSREAEQRLVAEAKTGTDAVTVHMRDEAVNPAVLPASVLHYVLRTHENVILDDAVVQPMFPADPYIQQHQARSLLCLPLLNQAKLIGVLYLENNLAPRVFAPGRIAVLKLLASQAAISLENTRLYRDLAEREAKIRRLVDANIIGIIVWNSEGQILDANDAFLRTVGYDRQDLASGSLRWMDMTAPEWLDRTARGLAELKTAGTFQPYEKEYIRKDGSRVPVLLGAASFDETASQGVSFVLDLTERKRAEAEARESERRYREVQMELAHANRAATMGQLAASIAHEVNQPIAASLTNAETALLWLDRKPPNLDEAREALGRIAKDATRAGEVIGRIRALIKKAPPRQDVVEINDAAREVIELTLSEAKKHGVSVRTEFADSLPLVHGDRVQLQQVVLNLIVNAIEAMSGIGAGPHELWISTENDEGGDVRVVVRDSGPGLPPGTRERLFDAFYTTKSNGLGMGLSICRSIVEAHGGEMGVAANLPRGASFYFTVPVHPESES